MVGRCTLQIEIQPIYTCIHMLLIIRFTSWRINQFNGFIFIVSVLIYLMAHIRIEARANRASTALTQTVTFSSKQTCSMLCSKKILWSSSIVKKKKFNNMQCVKCIQSTHYRVISIVFGICKFVYWIQNGSTIRMEWMVKKMHQLIDLNGIKR